jgi:hypothetical protein
LGGRQKEEKKQGMRANIQHPTSNIHRGKATPRPYQCDIKATPARMKNAECRMQVRSVKVCAAGGESPPSSAAKLPEFRMKVMNGKV